MSSLADVPGAGISVAAIEGFSPTGAVQAGVPEGAGIPVAARTGPRPVNASHRGAEVLRAVLPIVAEGQSLADPRLTAVLGGAGQAVIAGGTGQWPMATLPRLGVTPVARAGIVVLAIPNAPDALAALASVVHRAEVSVVALAVHDRVLTPQRGIAQVQRAWLPVVAGHRFAPAPTIQALVPFRAGVAIVAPEEVPLCLVPAQARQASDHLAGPGRQQAQALVIAGTAEAPVVPSVQVSWTEVLGIDARIPRLSRQVLRFLPRIGVTRILRPPRILRRALVPAPVVPDVPHVRHVPALSGVRHAIEDSVGPQVLDAQVLFRSQVIVPPGGTRLAATSPAGQPEAQRPRSQPQGHSPHHLPPGEAWNTRREAL